ncbi:hypothetical protein HY486_01910 [Candidatus Woesearchaeota archaeon]|nr:hypothetical protein [Candidatus Woesearchaeota archaeon]
MVGKRKEEIIVHELHHEAHHHEGSGRNALYAVMILAVVLLLFNQWQLSQLSKYAPASSFSASAPLSLKGGEKITYAPVLLAPGESPVLPSYGTKIKQLPTVSSQPQKPKTGDIVQDTLNMVIPVGTPEYGQQAGLSFDDPLGGQKTLGYYDETITLTPEEESRYNGIVNVFTCDYCCGSPQRPTIITRCGCAHAAGWRGLARWLIKNYGSQVTDEQIMGEMSKWKALWYPGPTVQRIIQEQSAGGSTPAASINQLPSMVGGC